MLSAHREVGLSCAWQGWGGGEQRLPSIQKGKWPGALGDRGGREGPRLPVEDGVAWGMQRSSPPSPASGLWLVTTGQVQPLPHSHSFPGASVWNCQCCSVLFEAVFGDGAEQPLFLLTYEVPCTQCSREQDLRVDGQLLTGVLREGACLASSWEEPPWGRGSGSLGRVGSDTCIQGLKEAGAFVVCGFHSGNPGHRQAK